MGVSWILGLRLLVKGIGAIRRRMSRIEREGEAEAEETQKSPMGERILVTDAVRAQAFWALRKYSSYRYIRRCSELLALFLSGYRQCARDLSPEWSLFTDSTISHFSTYLEELDQGLALLAKGDVGGYEHVLRSLWFSPFLESRSFQKPVGGFVSKGEQGNLTLFEYPNASEQCSPGVPFILSANRASMMAKRIDETLRARWSYAKMFNPPGPAGMPAELEPLPAGTGKIVRTGETVPISGIWSPREIQDGCPSYLRMGQAAPEALDQPLTRNFEYFYPTGWELVWEDRRYGKGPLPDEEGFLDEVTELPVGNEKSPLFH